MGKGIVGVIELVGHIILARFGVLGLVRPAYRSVCAFFTRCKHYFRAVGFKYQLAFHTDAVRHEQFYFVAFHRPHECYGDTGITGGGLDNGLALFQFPGFLRFLYHVVGRAVLYGAAGVIAFHFSEYPHVVRDFDGFQFNERRIADGVKNRVIAAIHSISFAVLI